MFKQIQWPSSDCERRRLSRSLVSLPEMRTRLIGGTGLAVTELGFGTAPIGNLYQEVDDDTVEAAIIAAWDAGVRYFDTAPHYGLGLAERRLGAVLARYPRSDGCTRTQALRFVALPLAKPLVGLLLFFSFVVRWTSYYLPFLLLTDETKYPLPVGLGALISGTPALNPANGASFVSIHKPEVALAGLITVAPIIVMFIFSQRFLVKGLLAGSTRD
jgi:hypothetical protein